MSDGSSANKTTEYLKRHIDLVLALVAAVILWTVLGVAFDYYYELNDDVLIKDIIAGVYTGLPDGHNNQMMYPISILLAGLYRLLPSLPWFGLFEIGCFIAAFIMITSCLSSLVASVRSKCAVSVLTLLTFFGLYTWELVMLQYTVVCGILCAAAAVWLYTRKTVTIKTVIPSIVLCILAYNVRSEMFLLMCPFLAACGISKWCDEASGATAAPKNTAESAESGGATASDVAADKNDATDGATAGSISIGQRLGRYAGVLAIIALGVAATFIIDKVAYSSGEWSEYRRFFDARTDVYDFTGIPPYEDNYEFYESKGITSAQYELLTDYNFALDDEIDSEVLEEIAAYVKSGEAIGAHGSPKGVRTAVREYVSGAIDFTMDDSTVSGFADEANQLIPMNLIVIVLYVCLIETAYLTHDKTWLIKLPTWIVLRSIPWVYIYMKGRLVPRITHPMYMIEILVLGAMIVGAVAQVRWLRALAAILIAVTCIVYIPTSVSYVNSASNMRMSANTSRDEVYGMTQADSDNYYYLDVYSTTGWTERVFETRMNKRNTQLAGGWIAKSPLDAIKQNSNHGEKLFLRVDNDEVKITKVGKDANE